MPPKRTSAAPDPDDDGKNLPAERDKESIRISEISAERARLCIRAAQYRSQHMTYAMIAAELGLVSPMVAYRAVQTGLTLIPSEDVREVRRLSDQRLDRMARELLDVIREPGPLVSQGKMMREVIGTDEHGKPIEGESFPDQMVRVRAIEALLKVDAEHRKSHGADAPKKSVQFTGDLIQARISELRRELGLGGEAIPGLAWPAGELEPPDGDSGQV